MRKKRAAVVVGAVLLLQQTSVFGLPGDLGATKTASRQYEALSAYAGELRGAIDKAALDRSAMLDRLGFEAENIVAFVKTKVGFEQYQGALRGAEGTFLSRAGNALDKSILLAEMLKDAGFDARINRGRLSTSQAQRLVSQIGLPIEAAEQEADTARVEEIVQRYSSELGVKLQSFETLKDGVEKQAQDESYGIRARSQAKWLKEILDKNAIRLGEAGGADELVDEARDYFWVDYRIEERSNWIAAHPAFHEGGGLDAIRPLTTYEGFIPAELQHRFRMQIYVQRNALGRVVSQALMDPWERPAANLARRPLTFHLVSASLNAQLGRRDITWHEIDAPESQSDIFLPIFDGQPLKNAFDLNGNVVPLEEAASAFAGVFASVSDKINSATGALARLGKMESGPRPERAAFLQSVKIVYTLIAPGGSETRYERVVYERGSESGRSAREDKLEQYRALTRKFSLMVETANVSDAFVVDQYLEGISRQREVAATAASIFESRRSTGNGPMDLRWEGHVPLFGLFDRGASDYYAYRSQPYVVVHHETLPFAGVVREGIDIVQNPSRAFAFKGGVATLDPESNLGKGVWETVIEAAPFEQSGVGAVTSTWSVFERMRVANAEVMVLRRSDMRRLEDLGISEATKVAVAQDLTRGRVVVLPKVAAQSREDYFAWWSIDPSTGSTLGKNGFGEGAAGTEYKAILMTAGFLSGALFAGRKCVDSNGGRMTFGCAVCGFVAGATTAMAVWLVLPSAAAAPAAAARMATARELAPSAARQAAVRVLTAAAKHKRGKLDAYFKALVLVFGGAASNLCGGTVLVK